MTNPGTLHFTRRTS